MSKVEVTNNSGNIGDKKRPVGTKLGLFLVAGLVFVAGMAVGQGDLRLASNSSSNEKIDYSSVDQLYEVLKKDYDGQLSKEEVLNGIKDGLVGATKDPYTEYLDAGEAKELNEELSGSFDGIGAELGKSEDNYVVIVAPLPNTPAERSGLKTKDVIVRVNDEDAFGWSVEKAKDKIRGPKGTIVKLTISRAGQKPFEVNITRDQIVIESVKSTIEDSIGYLKINQFTRDTAKLARAAANDFKAKGVKAVVLDLRGNPGGYLDSSVEVSSLFLEKGKVVVQQKKGKQVLGKEYSSGGDILKGLPTVVLIDGGSASASEITAGALKDNGVATLLGTKSFGKGSVQRVEKLPAGAELKVTVARWYTPAGKNIDKQGIEPDVKLENTDADVAAGRDAQKDRAYELLRQKL